MKIERMKVNFFKAMCHNVRLKIINSLAKGPKCTFFLF